MIWLAALLALVSAQDGQLSQFDRKAPDFDIVSTKNLYDLQECFFDIRFPGVPSVLRRPDKPGQMTLVWYLGTVARVDLRAVEGGTRVRAWSFPTKRVKACAVGPGKP